MNMETAEIFAEFSGRICPACHSIKRRQVAFCEDCFRKLPALLRSSLYKRFGDGFEQAYCGCLSWFRIQSPVRVSQKQKSLFEDAL